MIISDNLVYKKCYHQNFEYVAVVWSLHYRKTYSIAVKQIFLKDKKSELRTKTKGAGYIHIRQKIRVVDGWNGMKGENVPKPLEI